MYGCRGRSKICSVDPVSTNMPPYMTAIRSHMPGDDAEIVRDQDQRRVATPRRACAAARGSAPGSSRRAPSSARRRSGASACTQAPSRSSRAAASRPRTGAGSPSAARSALGIPTWSISSAARAVAAFLSMSRCVSSASRIWRPIVSTGLRLVIGSWKIIAISRPRIRRRSESESPIRSRPSNIARTARHATVPREDAEHGERRDALAAAGLADEAERLPRRDVERDAVDGVHLPARRLEPDAEVRRR